MGAHEYGATTGTTPAAGTPVVSITSPTSSSSFTAPASVTLTATASETNGTISKVEFYSGSTKISECAAAPYTCTWASVTAGTYSLTAVATDLSNVKTTSSAVAITVASPPTNTTTTSTGAIFYGDCGLSGSSVTLAPGNYTTANLVSLGIADNSISSIKVNGYKVIAYTDNNFTGTALTLTADNGCLVDAGFNDQISSIKVIDPNAANTAPIVSITAPANGKNYTAPATFAITASASDIDGTISKVEFYNGSIKLGEKTTAPYTFVWSSVPFGSYIITAVATDNLGAKTTSNIITVWINN